MPALPLNPHDTNYLSCRLINQQLTQNKRDFASFPSDVTPHIAYPPKIITDGTGRVTLEGAVVISGTPLAGMVIARLPDELIPQNDFYFAAAVDRSGDFLFNATAFESNTSGAGGVTIINQGTYAGVPFISIGAPGEGAILASAMEAKTIEVSNPGTEGYAPSDTITLAGGSAPSGFIHVLLTVNSTHISGVGTLVSITSGGTGGTPGPVTLTGTTGTGTKFQATGVIDLGGVLTGSPVISNTGIYTVNITDVEDEPVTGGGLTGAALGSLQTRVSAVTLTNRGTYGVVPSNPISQASTSGSGVGAGFEIEWRVKGAFVEANGNGYTTSSAVAFSGGSPIGSDDATGTLTLEVNSRGEVTLLNLPQTNDVVFLNNINFLVDPYY
jgi:hypothetical protein